MRPFILKMSNSRKNKSEKAKQVCEEMDANRRREGGGGAGGGGETRRIHVVYFLSRNGKTEQPHLIRVHHLNNNGVHLRDVKRWLSELRGREMPESFSWSYKRSYKAGHIWQDLTDNDLITPFSDNEYILKGSLIPSQHNKAVEQFFPFNGRSTISTRKQDREEEDAVEDEIELEEEEEEEISYESLQIEDNISPKPPPRGDEESPLRPVPSTSTSSEQVIENHTAAKSKRREEMKKGDQEKSCNEVVIKKSGSHVNRSNSKGRREVRPRRRAADILRNLLRCRLVDIKDSLKRESRQRNGSISRKNYQTSNSNNERKNWGKKGSINGGSRKMTEKSASVRYKPSTEPNCSQCGKPFKPEKLHSHMKSCMALKEKGRSSSFTKEEQTATRRPSKVTVTVL